MLTFFVGMMIGSVVGFMTFALLAVGDDDDWKYEQQITMDNEKEDSK